MASQQDHVVACVCGFARGFPETLIFDFGADLGIMNKDHDCQSLPVWFHVSAG